MTMDHLKKLGFDGLEPAVETLWSTYEDKKDGEWPSRRRQSLAKRSSTSPLCVSCPFAGWKCAPAKAAAGLGLPTLLQRRAGDKGRGRD